MNLADKVTLTVNGKRVSVDHGTTLARAAGVESPCGGHGKCGKCKVFAVGQLSPPSEEEKRLLTEREISDGVRLACLTRVLGDAEAEVPETTGTQIVSDGVMPNVGACPSFEGYGVAVDVGTTTVAAALYRHDGVCIGHTACLNPQTEFGADVISRIGAAMDGRAKDLTDAVRRAVDSSIERLRSIVDGAAVNGTVITGNTVMLSLLTGQSVEPLSHAPFKAERLFGEVVSAGALSLFSLDANTVVYLAPCISAFVGADVVCAILATELCRGDTAMLADIGTNGEIALWHDGRLSTCSTAAGPAFEGVGISHGMRADVGAIDRVCVAGGRLHAHVIGEAPPAGICGSGLLDAVSCMLDLEIVDDGGYLEDGSCPIAGDVSVSQEDVRMLQLAKSAVCAGILTLADNAGVSCDAITRLCVAGGFGKHLSIASAVRLGLLPASLRGRSHAVGNAALSGASMLLLDQRMRAKAERIASTSEVLELSVDSRFYEYYMNGMIFCEA